MTYFNLKKQVIVLTKYFKVKYFIRWQLKDAFNVRMTINAVHCSENSERT